MPVSQMENLHRGPASRGTASGQRLARATPGEFVVARRTESDGTGSNALEVVFYKEILDHCGFPHQCELMRVSITPDEQEQVIIDAIHKFETLQRVSHWKCAADGYAVVRGMPRGK
ncbi:hypothetical protein PTKU64_86780 [Paraburkholderia terrae]|uniref:DUF1488 domain-containing protein n=1 Tax=Paraburkholderia terrae TaxID=311230 RepID=A0ABN6JVL1_9BURK|nr:hypothetical protein PTKU64_86780 [Paraburkholderia terrae]BDC44965.1 hypothetical protein PTKU15_82620 [Paraburkholderia terrae]